MRSVAIFCGLALALGAGGCGRARVTTAIKPDGSWTRTVVFTGPEKKEGQVTPTLEDTFVFPSGAVWKSSEEKKDSDRIVTLERVLAAGAALQGDISIKSGVKDKLSLVNQATVTRAGPRRFEYRETLRWKGDPVKLIGDPETQDLAKIKASLPAPLATDANARAIARKTTELAVPLLFGPNDPLLAIGLFHPDLALRRAGQRMGTLLIKALEEQFGDQLTPTQRRDVARKLIQETFSSANPSTKISPPDPNSASHDSSGLVPLMFVLKAPGRVVSSNGEVDDLTGEVFWALFSDAAAFQDVVLTAVVEMD